MEFLAEMFTASLEAVYLGVNFH